MAGVYAGTTTLVADFSTIFGNKRVSLLKVDITNYYNTGIPLTARTAGMSVIECVIPFFTGSLAIAEAPVVAAYVVASAAVFLYTASNNLVNDDFNCNTNSILVYLLVIGV